MKLPITILLSILIVSDASDTFWRGSLRTTGSVRESMFSNQRFRIYITPNNGSKTGEMISLLDIDAANSRNNPYKWMVCIAICFFVGCKRAYNIDIKGKRVGYS